jgi:hypothetical protein
MRGRKNSLMSTQFRKSKKIGPFRVTASKGGFSASAGVPGARITRNSKGQTTRTLGVPGTGVYNTKRIGSGTEQGPTFEEKAEALTARLDAHNERQKIKNAERWAKNREGYKAPWFRTTMKVIGVLFALVLIVPILAVIFFGA